MALVYLLPKQRTVKGYVKRFSEQDRQHVWTRITRLQKLGKVATVVVCHSSWPCELSIRVDATQEGHDHLSMLFR